MDRLDSEFFTRHPKDCAKDLINCTFIWDDHHAKIVETEAYAALGDEACHTWFRPTARKFIAEHPVGTAYVYLNYGIHWLFNILIKSNEGDGFVLFRALETDPPSRACAGPGKLTKYLGIDGTAHGSPFLSLPDRGIFRGDTSSHVLSGPRIGISRARELPWRFGLEGSAALSAKFEVG